MRRAWLGVCSGWLFIAAGCGSDVSDALQPDAANGPPPGHAELPAREILAQHWAPASFAEDPFVEFSAGHVPCSPFALRIEANRLELTTLDCNYATLVYEFEADVASGTRFSGEMAWATLVSLEPAIGTLAIASARDGLLWTHKVRIPGEADIAPVRFVLGQPAPAGSALYFHVRNHGYNNWQLGPLTLTPPVR